MLKARLLLGIAIVISMMLTAGCTGTKTLVTDSHTADSLSAAADLYNTKVSDLRQQIGEIRAMAMPGNNSTMDDYMQWLGLYRTDLNATWDQYNDTVKAGNVYLHYLDNTSDEYRGVTSSIDAFKNDLQALESDYRQKAGEVETLGLKYAALSHYRDALNATADAYNTLAHYGDTGKINSMSDYSSYIGGFKLKLDAYDASCNDAIAAGKAYQQYLDPGSPEYGGVAQNEQALRDGMDKAQSSYDTMKSNYQSKQQAQSTASDYANKLGQVSAAKADLDKYDSSASALTRNNKSYVIGYRQKVQAFDGLCDNAIAAGNACLQYLDKNSTEYKTVTDNEKTIGDAKSHYDSSLNNLITMYNNLHMFDPIK